MMFLSFLCMEILALKVFILMLTTITLLFFVYIFLHSKYTQKQFMLHKNHYRLHFYYSFTFTFRAFPWYLSPTLLLLTFTHHALVSFSPWCISHAYCHHLSCLIAFSLFALVHSTILIITELQVKKKVVLFFLCALLFTYSLQ